MPAQASSAWMRRENAGCVTWRSWAERLKLRVSARLTKSSSHLVSMPAIIDGLGCGLPAPGPDASAAQPVRQRDEVAGVDFVAGLRRHVLGMAGAELQR